MIPLHHVPSEKIRFVFKKNTFLCRSHAFFFFLIRHHTPQLTYSKACSISGMEPICFHTSPSFEKARKLSHSILGLNAPQLRLTGVWRNGSASDSRSEGWEFESLCPHFLGLLIFRFWTIKRYFSPCSNLLSLCSAVEVLLMTLWPNG